MENIDTLSTEKYLVFFYFYAFYGGVVQLVRTSACHAEGREFESRHSRHIKEPTVLSALFIFSLHRDFNNTNT